MKLLSWFSAVFNRAVSFLAILGGVLIVLMMLLITAEVLMRYFFNRPIFWAEEVCAYGLLYVTFLGATWVLRGGGHVKVDVLLVNLQPRAQAMTNFITSILGALICLAITWYGTQSTWEHFVIGYKIPTMLSPPKSLILAIIPLGSLALFIQFLRKIYGHLKAWKTPEADREQVERTRNS